MKKILVSLGIIGLVGAMAISATMSYFSDTETSTGNVFTAGSIDLKVDHTVQTYNDVDCKTCNLVLISDPTNMVVARNATPLTPYPAVYLSYIHPAWTAQNDPLLVAAGAKWVWERDPVRQEDTTTSVTYTFEKDFEWWGPITSSDFEMAVGHDNTVKVWLNGVNIANGTNPYGYRIENMLHISGTTITNNINQGDNILKFVVTNIGLSNGTPSNNPAGLIYKFAIGGPCENDYFRSHCTLFGEKDLVAGDYFWQFDDIKPGDRGTNVISLHVETNDAYACLITGNIDDQENDIVDPETTAGDLPNVGLLSGFGELSPFIKVFAWYDDGDGIYEGEAVISGPNVPLSLSVGIINLTASTTKYIGLAWCAGTQSVSGNVISCDGSTMGNIAQTDSFTADVTAYAEQQRNNPNFSCASVTLP